MNMPCPRKITCPGTDEPVANFSSEEADSIKFIGVNYFFEPPPLGYHWGTAGCLAYCESAVSQQDADDCALRQAQLCTYGGGGGPGGGGNPGGDTNGWTDPGGNPVQTFCNTEKYCAGHCTDGLPFYARVPPCLVISLSQAAADSFAQSLACLRVAQNMVCIQVSNQRGCCGTAFQSYLVGQHAHVPVTWYMGTLPAGLTASVVNGNTLLISGIPTVSGTSTVTFTAVDYRGNYMSKNVAFTFYEITPTMPPDPEVGIYYDQQLTLDGYVGDLTLITWAVADGYSLPDGLILNDSGRIVGTPTTAGLVTFDITATFP